MTSKTMTALYGNVGADPEIRTIPGKTVTRPVYDHVIDEVLEHEYTTRDREVRTFSIAVSKRGVTDEDGNEITRWIRCDDWDELSRLVRKGDRVRVVGYFRTRTVKRDDGETKTYKNFIVKELSIERRKLRSVAA